MAVHPWKLFVDGYYQHSYRTPKEVALALVRTSKYSHGLYWKVTRFDRIVKEGRFPPKPDT